jgi:hypothetical protein
MIAVKYVYKFRSVVVEKIYVGCNNPGLLLQL